MEEIVEVRDAAIIAAEITAIKEQTQRMVLSASIEIGRRLTEAKELVQHGEWATWLQDKCSFSQRTADNLMRIYREYGNADPELASDSQNSQAYANLTYSQAVALLGVPADERSGFLEENDVSQMTSRQLQDAIKARETAEKEKAELEEQGKQMQNKLDGTNQLLQIANESKGKLQEALNQSDREKSASEQRLNETIRELQDKIEQFGNATPSPEELKKIRSAIRKEIEEDFKKKADRLANEKKSAEEKASEIEKAYEEKLRHLKLDNESIQAREQEARKQLATASPQIHQCTAYMTSIQQSFGNVLSIISSVKAQNPELSEKLQTGMKKILEQLISQIS